MEINNSSIAQLERKSDIFRALGHPIRLKVVYLLSNGEQSVSRISNELNSKISNISRHLGRLKSAGVILSRKRGLSVYYRLNLPFLTQMLTDVRMEIGRVDS